MTLFNMWITILLFDGRNQYLIINVVSTFALSYPLVLVYQTRPGLWEPRQLEYHRYAVVPVPYLAQGGREVQGMSCAQ